jgi:hypothetical protein
MARGGDDNDDGMVDDLDNSNKRFVWIWINLLCSIC